MYFHQDSTNVAAKRASSGEISKWRDEGVDPELLSRPTEMSFRPEEQQTVMQMGDYSLRAAIASEMPVNGVQESFERRYTKTI